MFWYLPLCALRLEVDILGANDYICEDEENARQPQKTDGTLCKAKTVGNRFQTVFEPPL
jgi:hypothetical protein